MSDLVGNPEDFSHYGLFDDDSLLSFLTVIIFTPHEIVHVSVNPKSWSGSEISICFWVSDPVAMCFSVNIGCIGHHIRLLLMSKAFKVTDIIAAFFKLKLKKTPLSNEVKKKKKQKKKNNHVPYASKVIFGTDLSIHA